MPPGSGSARAPMLRPIKSELKEVALDLFRTVRGDPQLERSLHHRREFHRRRGEEEHRILAEARTQPNMFRSNICPACGSTEAQNRFTSPIGFSFTECLQDGTV